MKPPKNCRRKNNAANLKNEKKSKNTITENNKNFTGRKKLIHGFPHVERVLEGFNLLKKDNRNSSNNKFLDALEWSVYLHDIGRVKKSPDHGVESVIILNKYYKREFPENVNMRDEICYAIENHQKYLDVNKKINGINSKEKLLVFLILLDCMDTIGEKGINRTVRDTDIPLMPEDIDKEKNKKIKRVNTLLNKPDKREEVDRDKMKNSSILEHISYNYAFTSQIKNRIKNDRGDIKIGGILKEIENRLKISKKFCNNLLKLK